MSLKTDLPKCGRSSTFQKVQCKIQGSECPENTKEKISWSLLNKKGMVHGTCRNNYKQTCKYVLNDNAHGTNYFLKW
jgi:hypothetical protein